MTAPVSHRDERSSGERHFPNWAMRARGIAIVWAVAVFPSYFGCGGDPNYNVTGLTHMLKNPDPEKRCTAARHLGKFGGEAKEAVPQLTEALQDEDPTVRVSAAYALAGIGRPANSAVPDLLRASKSNHAELRLAAISALGTVDVDSAPALAALKTASQDNNQQIREEAQRGLRRFENAKKYRDMANQNGN